MPNFLPQIPPFGRKPLYIHLCECPKCGFKQKYQLDAQVVIVDDDDPTRSDIQYVDELPRRCPHCQARLTVTKIPLPIVY